MIKDEIIKEVWRGKDAVAAKYKYDAVAMAKALQDREKQSSAKVVNLHVHLRPASSSPK
jgi:hypothetical protein